MKELSIEQKARAYDEAVEKSKRLYEQGTITESLAYIFPELAESEDEKIRKELIVFLEELSKLGKNTNFDRWKTSDCANWIAWLGKQGGISKLSEEEQNRFAKGVLTSSAMSFIDYLDAHKYKGKMCVSNGECEDIENAFHNAMWDRLHRYYCKYIEKQGEQKSTIEMKSAEESLGIDSETYNKIVDECIYGEQKPTDETPYPETLEKAIDLYYYSYGNGEGEFEHLSLEKFRDIVHTFVSDYGQKPAWSEEDERILNGLISSLVRIGANTRTDSTSINYTFQREINWLKSIKQRMGG